MKEESENRLRKLTKSSEFSKTDQRDIISYKKLSNIKREIRENKYKKNYKSKTKYDKIPDLKPRNFFEFLEKFPICKDIVEGNFSTPFIKRELINRILDFFEDQDINDYTLKICLGESFESKNLRKQLSELKVSYLKNVPFRIYKCYYENDVKVSSSFKAKKKHKKTHKKKKKKSNHRKKRKN